MPFLIDGYNLFHAAQSVLPQGFDLGRSQLMSRLGGWVEATGEKLTVVWDGTPPPAQLAGQLGDKRVAEIYAGGKESADARIAKLLETDSGVREIVVVSNDREVQHSARRCGARVEECEAFLRRVVKDMRRISEKSSGQEPDEKRRGLKTEDARDWLSAFGFDPDAPADFEHP